MDVSMGIKQTRAGTLSGAVLVRISALLLAAVAIAANFTNYGALIPLLQSALHISSGQVGLFSTLLYGGIACTYLPGGILADRYGSRRVLIGSLLLIGLGGCLLPLFANLPWMLLCRAMIGLGSGAAIVAGSQASARLGAYAALGQGLYGGAMQVGAGLGLFLTPQLLTRMDWQGTFVCWGVFALLVCLFWHAAIPEETAIPLPVSPRRLSVGWRTPAIWCLGLIHLGTLGIGQAIAPWLTLYFAETYGLPVPLAAMLGSVGLFAGMLFRPLGGALLSRKVFGAVSLVRIGTILTCAGVGLLALPTAFDPLVGVGIALLSFGTTIAYAAVFSEAGRVGQVSGIGTGTAQGMVSLLSAPASSLGPPLIGLLLARSGGFSTAFGVLALIGLLPVSAALLAGLLLLRARLKPARYALAKEREVLPGGTPSLASGSRERDLQVQAMIGHLQARQRPQISGAVRPLIAIFDSCQEVEGQQSCVLSPDAPPLRQLLAAGGMPVLLSAPSASLQAHPCDVLADEDLFQRTFEQMIWPLFSQLVLHQISGICLSDDLDQPYPYTALKAYEGSPVRGSTPTSASPEQWRKLMERYLGLLVWLVGIPILGGGAEMQRLQAREGQDGKAATGQDRATLQKYGSLPDKEEVSGSVFAAFVADCSAFTPLSLESLQPLYGPIRDWLRRRDLELLRGRRRAQVMARQKTRGQQSRTIYAPESPLATRLTARQRKLNAMRALSAHRQKTTVADTPV